MLAEDDLLDDHCLQQLEKLITFMNQCDLYSAHGREFARQTATLDGLRREKALDVFPELAIMLSPADHHAS